MTLRNVRGLGSTPSIIVIIIKVTFVDCKYDESLQPTSYQPTPHQRRRPERPVNGAHGVVASNGLQIFNHGWSIPHHFWRRVWSSGESRGVGDIEVVSQQLFFPFPHLSSGKVFSRHRYIDLGPDLLVCLSVTKLMVFLDFNFCRWLRENCSRGG